MVHEFGLDTGLQSEHVGRVDLGEEAKGEDLEHASTVDRGGTLSPQSQPGAYGPDMEPWWNEPMRRVFDGHKIVLAGAPATAWTEHIALLREAGAADVLVVATQGAGVGPLPDVETVVVQPPDGLSSMQRIHFANEMLEHPRTEVVEALDRFDPDGTAVIVGTFLNTAAALDGRPFLSHRRPEWLALEDKVVVDEFWERAGIGHQPATVVPLADVDAAAARIDRGAGTVWAADAREGFHGGAAATHWVVDDDSRQVALDALGPMCDRVRVMPFLDGVPCSVHGIVLPDGIAVLRPVEMVTLRQANRFVYAGCATYWDPPAEIRHQMRHAARRAGAQLADEVDFRGTFTVDGVHAADGFWPTELNPRFGAGINVIARASGLPILMLDALISGGVDIGRTARDLESELVAAADDHRGGGTWTVTSAPDAPNFDRRAAVDDLDGFRWAGTGDVPTARVTSGPGFIRCLYEPEGVAVGPSTAPRAARFWAFADRELAAGLGPLSPAPDLGQR